MPEGGRGGRAAGRTARTKPQKAAQRSGDGEEGQNMGAGALCDNERGGALGGTPQGPAAASQSDCKRAPGPARPLVRRMEYYEKKKKTRAV